MVNIFLNYCYKSIPGVMDKSSSRKTALFFIFLTTLQQLVPMVATSHLPGIENYVIRRRGKGDPDLFRVVYSNSICPVSLCASSRANVFDLATHCSCACKPKYPTFLPQLGKCCNKATVKDTLFESCSSFFEWPFFLKSLNLESEGYKKHSNSKDYDSCHVVPQTAAYYNYQVQNKWVDIQGDIFSVGLEGNQIAFKWRAVSNKELLGRIIRVKINCSYSASGSRAYKIGCLVFKAKGEITYNLHGDDNHSLQSSTLAAPQVGSYPSAVSPSASSTASLTSISLLPSSSPSVTFPQLSTKATSILVHPSSSFPSPQPHQTKSPTTSLTSPVTSETVTKYVTSMDIQSSSVTTAPSSLVADSNGPGKKDNRTTGNVNNGVVIGAAACAAVVIGILVIVMVVFCKRRKLRTSNNDAETTTKQEDIDIQMGRTREKSVTTNNGEKDDQKYQGLVFDRGQINGAALYSTSEDNSRSNSTFYQSLGQKTPEISDSVYQGLKKGQHDTGKPKPKPRTKTAAHLNNRAKVMTEPAYGNGVKQPDVEQGNMPEPLYNVLEGPDPESAAQGPNSDHLGDMQDPLYVVLEESGPENDYGSSEGVDHGDTNDPLYNVLEGPDTEPVYEFQNVGTTSVVQEEPMYINVQKGPETKQGPKEPISCMQESPDAQNSSPGTQGPNESLYKAFERTISDGPNKSGADYVPSNLPFYLAAYDNPAFDQSLESDVAFGVVVRRPKPKRESVYEPLRADRNDLYQALSKAAVK